MSNKSQGTAFEREFAEVLADYGFWAHCMKDNQNGQPFDIIAARSGATYVFDCKDCQGSIFQLSRIEENQHNAMLLWNSTGNGQGLFAIRFMGEIYVIPHWVLIEQRECGIKQMSQINIQQYGQSFECWIKNRNGVDEWIKGCR